MYLATSGSREAEQVEISQAVLEMKDEQAVLDAAEVVRWVLKKYHEDVRDYDVRVPVEEIELMRADRRRSNFMFFIVA